MRRVNLLAGLLILLCSFGAKAQVFTVDTILYSGNPNKLMNLVFLSDGFTSAQMDSFIHSTHIVTDYIFATSPYTEYKNYFNVFAVEVASVDSGTNHPGNATDELSSGGQPIASVNVYFNSTFDYQLIHRLLVAQNDSLVNACLLTNYPLYDQKAMLINSKYYGGAGGNISTSSLHPLSKEVMLHEMGHSIAHLADEYWAGDGFAIEKPNMSQQSDPQLVRWKNWIGFNNVGVYQYCCGGNSALWYHPSNNCKMRTLGQPYCPVCKEAIIETIHDHTPSLDSYSPNADSVGYCGQSLDFGITTIKPIPNTLKVTWTLNSIVISSNVESLTVSSGQLNSGNDTLTVSVIDTTAFVRADLHPVNHTYKHTWIINYFPIVPPVITANGPLTICSGDTVQLTASGGQSYAWSTGATTAMLNVGAAGTYTVTVTNPSGCTASTSENIIVNPAPIPSIIVNGSTTLCLGDTIGLTASGGQSYEWSTGETNNAISVSTTGDFIVTVTDSIGCSASATQNITSTVQPSIAINGSPNVCDGDTVLLTASGANTYLWSTGATTAALTVTVSGNYIVTATNSSGCSWYTSQQVNVYPNPAMPVITQLGNNLISSSSSSYQWYFNGTELGGATSQGYTPTQHGLYQVLITDSNGCSALSAEYNFNFTGVNEILNTLSMSIHPNPTEGKFLIEANFPNADPVTIELTNLVGEKLLTLQENVTGNYTHEMDIETLPDGVYFLSLRSGSGTITQKLVKLKK